MSKIRLISTADWLSDTVFDISTLEERSGFIALSIKGKQAQKVFAHESGGHRWQRVPPTEKRGRRQTSTITVAVLPEPRYNEVQLEDKDIAIFTRRGSGSGGQHKNKTDSCVDVVHKPTGIKVTIDGRSQHENKKTALRILSAKLLDFRRLRDTLTENTSRKAQIGCGMRGDKIRTIRVYDDLVVDHQLNRKVTYKQYVRGNFPWVK